MMTLVKNIYFLFNVLFIILYEAVLYWVFNNFESFIERLTKKLSKINILYVKMFQAFALNNSLIDANINNKLLQFTDNAPWTVDDLDPSTLIAIEDEYNIQFKDGFEPINSGMISLVFKGCKVHKMKDPEYVIVKMKRKNIEAKLSDAIEKLLFCVYCLSFIPFINKYQISEVIHKNIGLIEHQVNFSKEVENMVRIQNNCKHLKYVKIPQVNAEVTKKYPNVIFMEYINGLQINKIHKDDYDDFAKQVVKFGFVTTLLHGVSHGDLHAGNILFIKDDADTKYKHKIGILDFGIIFEIDNEFKQTMFDIFTDLFVSTPQELAIKFLKSGIIEPLDVIQNLPKEHYNNIVTFISKILDETIHSSKQATQLQMYNFLVTFNSYMDDNKLTSLGLRPSDNFVKTQLALAIAHGITLTLCNDDYIGLADRVINELFHTNLLQN